jgi:phosphate starvation-inducible PhoH-like protein
MDFGAIGSRAFFINPVKFVIYLVLSSNTKVKKRISIQGVDQIKLFGLQDNHLKAIQNRFNSKIVARGSEIILEGESEDVNSLQKIFYELILMVTKDQEITKKDLETIFELVESKNFVANKNSESTDSVILYTKDGFIKPKSKGQRAFCESSKKNDIVFVIGPAGTGKTFLAVALAVAALRDREIDRIVLTRPAVEAGESLGFLPGDFREKIDPYLRPLYDALNNMIPADKLKRYLETRVIEIIPLAYMRGRTLNNAFVILDEAQNTSFNQMKMFLTRLGINSKAIVTGDITQIDLADSKLSGLVQIQSILTGIEGIEFIYLTEHDVVRHRLVRDIIRAYDAYENRDNNQNHI